MRTAFSNSIFAGQVTYVQLAQARVLLGNYQATVFSRVSFETFLEEGGRGVC